MPGFSTTGDMPLAFTGPIGLTFNYADAGPGFAGAPQLFWLASAFETPAYAAFQIPYAKASPRPLDLLWGAGGSRGTPPIAGRPLDLMFRSDNIVYLRSAWADPPALFVAFKGGDNRVSHAHLDLGSFVFDALGQRWAIDLGPDDYNRPGYFEQGHRWTYYRCRAEGNNCLLINPGDGPDQSPTATADVTHFHSDARPRRRGRRSDQRLRRARAERPPGHRAARRPQAPAHPGRSAGAEKPRRIPLVHAHRRGDRVAADGARPPSSPKAAKR